MEYIFIDRNGLRNHLKADLINRFWDRFTEDEWTDLLKIVMEFVDDDSEGYLDDAYHDGYEEGYREGESNGLEMGYDDGYDAGFRAGLAEGTERVQNDV